jgi:hypothetical protein
MNTWSPDGSKSWSKAQNRPIKRAAWDKLNRPLIPTSLGYPDKLAEALQADIGWIRRHTEFGEAARHWMEGGRASGMLLRPRVLDQAEAWMAFRPSGAPSPTAETEVFHCSELQSRGWRQRAGAAS